MYKQHLLLNLKREIDLLKQLAPLIEAKDLEYRPHEKIRSTYELMQYLGTIGEVIFRWMLKNDITPEVRLELKAKREAITIDNFSTVLDEQMRIIEQYMADITEDELYSREVEMPSKEKMVLGAAIINGPIKWLAAYRMDLFMFLKMNGKFELGTKEAWILAE